tara:strand:+ start:116 stop:364 length:249 start_codon:yes stop_codon:yes gene_type:complete
MKDVYPIPFAIDGIKTSRELVTKIVDFFLDEGVFKQEDCFLMTHGDDLTGSRVTSTLKICRVADVLAYGKQEDDVIHAEELL